MSPQPKNSFISLRISKPRNLKNDLLSGITVALALVPEAIAFAFIVGIDPTIGLYAAFMMGLITAILGGRPGMISGATGAVAVIFAPLVAQQLQVGTMESALGYLFAAVMLMGLIQILFGVLKLGKFIRLVPHPVMLGFVNGLAIVIFKSQFDLFGIKPELDLLVQLPQLGLMLGLIALTMAVSYFLPKLTKAIPATLAAIVIVTGLSFFLRSWGLEVPTILDFVQDHDPSRLTLAAGLPTFSLPNVPFSWETLQIIFPYALLAAAVGLIESLMTLTLVDELTDTRGQSNRESIGQGFANLVNGLFGGMGGCAMIGQSVINIRAGGRGRTSGITAALALLCFILFAAPLIELIPLAALVGVMFMVVLGTFEWTSLRLFGKIPGSDALTIVLVSLVTVVFDLATAVAVGVIFSALVFAWKKGKKIDNTVETDQHGTKIYHPDGSLFFGSAQSFKDLFNYKDDPTQVVIDFSKAKIFDHSGLEAVNFVAEKYTEQGKKLHLLNVSQECKDLLIRAESIVELTLINDLHWHLADDALE